MLHAPIPANDSARVAALKTLEVLDTPAEERFDRFTRIAQHILQVPIVLISLVDSERQWFKSRLGLDATETARDISFCGHAIMGAEVFVVPDALADQRFADNPLVTEAPDIRFYAGAPLRLTDGYTIGTLCAIDRVPRQISEERLAVLSDLAACVSEELERERGRRQALAATVNQARYMSIVESSNDAIVTKTLDGIVTSWNPAAETMFGYPAEEMVGAPMTRLIPVERLDEELVILARMRGGQRIDHFETVRRRKSGELFPVSVTISPIKDGSGTIVGASKIIRDVSDRKRTDEALKQSEARLTLAMDAARLSLWDADLTTQHFTLDARWNELAGYEPKEVRVSFDRMISLLPPDEAEEVRARTSAVIRGEGVDYFVQHRVRHRDGHLFWVESRGRVVQWDSAGVATRMSGVSLDITERKDGDEALRRSESRLQLAMMAARTSLWDADIATGRVVLDSRWAELLGNAPEETESSFQSLASLTVPEERAGVMEKMLAALKGQQPDYVAEHRVQHSNGNWIWIESRGKVVERGPDGRALRMVGTNTDISERRGVEQMKAEFVSMVSHELRTPLTSVNGVLGLVCGGAVGPVTDKAKELLDVAYKNSQRLIILINDLLDMEKLAAGKMQFDMQRQELMPLIEQSIESTRAYAQQYRVTIALQQRVDNVLVEVDAGRVMQVMSNFLSNAAKFSPAGGQIEVIARKQDTHVRVEVVDHGLGIPDEFRARIFQKFSQADSSDTRQKGGTGLGLAITKELIERMNGHIGFDSTQGVGSCFYFELPIVREATH